MAGRKIQSLRTYFRDIRLIAKGIGALVMYGLSEEEITLRLSQFSSTAHPAEIGHPDHYELIIMNNSPEPAWCSLLVDFYFTGGALHPDGPYAFFEKRVYTSPGEQQRVTFFHDWGKRATFTIQNVPFKPDTSWQKGAPVEGRYILSAFLMDEREKRLDELILIQHVLP